VVVMQQGHAQKPKLALLLDDATRSALQEGVRSIAANPEEWLGIPDVTFEPESWDQFQMDVVLCTDHLCRLPSDFLQTLHDQLRDEIAAAPAEGNLVCRGMELFGSDKSHLIARFRVPTELVQLRRTLWRACREFRVAFPDAIWVPHIRLGRIKASRGQLNKVTLRKLPAPLSNLTIHPKALTLLGKRPEDEYCDLDWDGILSFKRQQASSTPHSPMPWPPATATEASFFADALGPRGSSAPVYDTVAPAVAAARVAAAGARSATAPVADADKLTADSGLEASPARTSGFVFAPSKLRKPPGSSSRPRRLA